MAESDKLIGVVKHTCTCTGFECFYMPAIAGAQKAEMREEAARRVTFEGEPIELVDVKKDRPDTDEFEDVRTGLVYSLDLWRVKIRNPEAPLPEPGDRLPPPPCVARQN